MSVESVVEAEQMSTTTAMGTASQRLIAQVSAAGLLFLIVMGSAVDLLLLTAQVIVVAPWLLIVMASVAVMRLRIATEHVMEILLRTLAITVAHQVVLMNVAIAVDTGQEILTFMKIGKFYLKITSMS